MKRYWCACFSQTGSEILEISNQLGFLPDVIVYNANILDYKKINKQLIEQLIKENKSLTVITVKPTVEDYKEIFTANSIITLHGWLRIIPPEICNQFEIYNGHPGLINKYSILKGKDPQEKAFKLGLKTSGCVIHKVTKEVDAGEILDLTEVSIENLKLDTIINKLHDESVKLWIKFLKEKLCE